MAYVTISTWKVEDSDAGIDAIWKTVQDKYVPMNKALGATQTMVVEIGEGESAFINVYPNQQTRDAADAKIAALRAEGASEFTAKMTGELRGEVRASSD
jgi:hypothetical protein